LEKDSETFPSFFSKVPFIYLFIYFWFYDMQWWETKTCCGKGVNKNMVGKRERDANVGRRA
jgi:hypothetical protein